MVKTTEFRINVSYQINGLQRVGGATLLSSFLRTKRGRTIGHRACFVITPTLLCLVHRRVVCAGGRGINGRPVPYFIFGLSSSGERGLFMSSGLLRFAPVSKGFKEQLAAKYPDLKLITEKVADVQAESVSIRQLHPQYVQGYLGSENVPPGGGLTQPASAD